MFFVRHPKFTIVLVLLLGFLYIPVTTKWLADVHLTCAVWWIGYASKILNVLNPPYGHSVASAIQSVVEFYQKFVLGVAVASDQVGSSAIWNFLPASVTKPLSILGVAANGLGWMIRLFVEMHVLLFEITLIQALIALGIGVYRFPGRVRRACRFIRDLYHPPGKDQ